MSRREGSSAKRAFIVYAAFGLTCVIGAVGILSLLGANFGLGRDVDQYSAIFSDASGIEPRDDVRIAGLPVGAVQNVALHGNERARVTFTVPADRRLRRGTRVEVVYENLTGGRVLSLRRGSGNGPPIEPGSTLPDSQTKGALNLDVLLAGFEPLFEGLPAQDVNKLMANIVSILQGQGGTVESLLSHTASLTNTIADRDRLIGRVVNNLNVVLGSLDNRRAELSKTLTEVDALVGGLARERGRVGQSLGRVNTLVTRVDGLVSRVRGPLRGTVDQLGRATREVNAEGKALNEILRTLPGAYLRLGRLASRGSYYNLGLCAVRFKLTGPNGQPVYTPWAGPNDQVERCNPDSSPLETPAERRAKGDAPS